MLAKTLKTDTPLRQNSSKISNELPHFKMSHLTKCDKRSAGTPFFFLVVTFFSGVPALRLSAPYFA